MAETQTQPRAQEPATDHGFVLRDTDVRRKRPPVLSFLLRWETVRRAGRVLSLLALDLAGLFAAIFTALALEA